MCVVSARVQVRLALSMRQIGKAKCDACEILEKEGGKDAARKGFGLICLHVLRQRMCGVSVCEGSAPCDLCVQLPSSGAFGLSPPHAHQAT